MPSSARCVCAVDIAMSASCSAVGFGFTPQSANSKVLSPASVGDLSRSRKQLLAVWMAGAVPTQWNAARSMSGVEAMLPATMPDTRPVSTIMAPTYKRFCNASRACSGVTPLAARLRW